jgi:predicted DNA binding CopG/RHH family protein
LSKKVKVKIEKERKYPMARLVDRSKKYAPRGRPVKADEDKKSEPYSFRFPLPLEKKVQEKAAEKNLNAQEYLRQLLEELIEKL